MGACDINLVTWAQCSILIGSPPFLLRCDWLVPSVASITTLVQGFRLVKIKITQFPDGFRLNQLSASI